jgi:hypothetical protein
MSNSLIFADGFDDYTDVSQRWNTTSNAGGACFISSSVVRTGARSLKLAGVSLNGNARISQSFTARPTYIVGEAIFMSSMGVSELISFLDSGNYQVTLTVDPAGQLQARRGSETGTILGTASSLLLPNPWHYLEFRVTISSASGVVQVWLDGALVLNLTGQNTQVTGNASATTIEIKAGNSDYYVDDFYILDPTAGGAYSGPLGDVKMVTNVPSGNGTQNDYSVTFASFLNSHGYVVGETFKDGNNNVQRCTIPGTSASSGTPTWATTGGATTTSGGATFAVVGTGSNPGAQNWMAASDNPPDDNSSYVTDSTVGHLERYTYPSISGSAVKAVLVNMRAGKDDAGTRTIRAAGKSGSTTFDSGTDLALPFNSYQDFQGVFERDPNTGVAWTASGVNAAEFGIKTTT